MILKIEESAFETIPPNYRRMFQILKIEPQDFEQHRNDEHFVILNREYKKASKKLRDYLFQKRNNK